MNSSVAKKVAAVVVTYRSEVWIEKCLDSLILQPEITKIWVVDNASDDNTAGLVKAHYPNVHLISNSNNIGFAAANNQALEKISETYVLLLNPDAFLEEGALGHMLAAMEDEKVSAVGPRIFRGGEIEPSLNLSPRALEALLFLFSGMRAFKTGGFSGQPAPGFPWNQGAEGDHLRGSCILVRQAIIETVGLMDERFFLYFEETEWCLRMRSSGWNIRITSDAVAHHVGKASVRTTSALPSLEYMRGAVLFWGMVFGSVVSRGLRAVLWSMALVKYLLLIFSKQAVERRVWLKKVMGLAINPYSMPIEYEHSLRPSLWKRYE